MKCLNLGPKMPYLVFFFGEARIFKKLFSYLKSATSNLSNWKILQKKKCLNLGPKMPHLGIFELEF